MLPVRGLATLQEREPSEEQARIQVFASNLTSAEDSQIQFDHRNFMPLQRSPVPSPSECGWQQSRFRRQRLLVEPTSIWLVSRLCDARILIGGTDASRPAHPCNH